MRASRTSPIAKPSRRRSRCAAGTRSSRAGTASSAMWSSTSSRVAVARQYFSSVEAGVKDALNRGPLGFPVVDVAVTLTDGSYHTVDSSDMAFRAAAKVAIGEALPKARPVLLEPILSVDIAVPSEAMSRATSLVAARRGQILGYDARPGWEGWD